MPNVEPHWSHLQDFSPVWTRQPAVVFHSVAVGKLGEAGLAHKVFVGVPGQYESSLEKDTCQHNLFNT